LIREEERERIIAEGREVAAMRKGMGRGCVRGTQHPLFPDFSQVFPIFPGHDGPLGPYGRLAPLGRSPCGRLAPLGRSPCGRLAPLGRSPCGMRNGS